MQGSRRARFGGIVLLIWAIAVLAMLFSAWIGQKTAKKEIYDGAVFVLSHEERMM